MLLSRELALVNSAMEPFFAAMRVALDTNGAFRSMALAIHDIRFLSLQFSSPFMEVRRYVSEAVSVEVVT